MRNWILLLVVSAALWSCGDDNDDDTVTLNHDGDNFTAPFLPAGIHEAAARFTGDVVSNFEGRDLVSVSYYMTDVPSQVEVIVYEGGITSPARIVYQQNVSGQTSAGRFNEHTLSDPFTLGTEPVWLAVRMTLTAQGQAIGCDNGNQPNPNGDWLDFEQQGWTNFSILNPTESINWNIRGEVQ